jgi:hypothetical protein
MPRRLLVLSLLIATLAVPAAAQSQPDLRPLLEIHTSTLTTDSFNFSDARITIYQGGTLVYQARGGPDVNAQTCVNTTVALGTATPAALQNLKQALRNGQVGTQRTCGLGTGFGTNLEYELEWTSPTRRMNRFEFGTFYQSGCPAGVAIIKNAVDRFVRVVLNDPRTRIIRSTPCPR